MDNQPNQIPQPAPQVPQTPQEEPLVYTAPVEANPVDNSAPVGNVAPVENSTPIESTSPAVSVAPAEIAAPVENNFSQIDATEDQNQLHDVSINWSAQEYIHPDKTPIWYFLFGFIALALVALDIFLVKSWLYSFSALVVVMSVAVMVYIRRPARTIIYGLSSAQGLYVGEQLYPFEDFKSFGLIKVDGENSVMLVPRKRFAPGVSVYFPETAGEQIVDILGSRLPMEDLKLDIFDIVVKKLRL